MKTKHLKNPYKDPRYSTPRLFCNQRLLQRNRAQTEIRSEVTCNHCRHLLGLPELKKTRPYKRTWKKSPALLRLERDTHLDTGSHFLFCDQRRYSSKFTLVPRSDVTCHTCLFLLDRGSDSLTEHYRSRYEAVRATRVSDTSPPEDPHA